MVVKYVSRNVGWWWTDWPNAVSGGWFLLRFNVEIGLPHRPGSRCRGGGVGLAR